MDPFTIMAVSGLALQAGGMLGSFGSSRSATEADLRMAQLQKQQNDLRRQAMELSARRQQTENLRNTQLQRSMSLNAATNQGAQYGSGYAGGSAQVRSTGDWNAQGIKQNLELGEKNFDLDDQMNQQKMAKFEAQSQQAMWQGVSSLGSSMTSAAGTFGKLTAGFGSQSSTLNPQTYGQFVKSIGSNGIY